MLKPEILGAIVGILVNSTSNFNNYNYEENLKVNNQALLVTTSKEITLDNIGDYNLGNQALTKIFSNKDNNLFIYCYSFDPVSQLELKTVKEDLSSDSDILCADYDYVGTKGSFDDQYSGRQWSLEYLDYENAYNEFYVDPTTVKVGIIDSGIEGSHEDLVGKVDRTLSKSFVDNSPLEDPIGHGTAISGIIGANKNSIGITGLVDDVDLVSLKINWYTSEVISAINYAEENDIKIINFSGYNFAYSSTFELAIENYSGLFVTIAGNDDVDLDENPTYPANFKTDNMIVVGGITRSSKEYPAGNYGDETVDILAPASGVYSLTRNNTYRDYDGTSLAAPFVTATAALIMTQYPTISVSKLKSMILDNATLNSDLAYLAEEGRVLNLYDSLKEAHGYNHSYTDSYDWYNYRQHYSYCKCGERMLMGHVVESGAFGPGDKYAQCLLCGGSAEIGLVVGPQSINSSSSDYYVLDNGVIVVSKEIADIIKSNR